MNSFQSNSWGYRQWAPANSERSYPGRGFHPGWYNDPFQAMPAVGFDQQMYIRPPSSQISPPRFNAAVWNTPDGRNGQHYPFRAEVPFSGNDLKNYGTGVKENHSSPGAEWFPKNNWASNSARSYQSHGGNYPSYFQASYPVGMPYEGIPSDQKTNLKFSKRKTNKLCTFCRQNGECKSFYSMHVLKDEKGKVKCPVLYEYTCPFCGATGDDAHTKAYCPILKESKAPLAIRLKTTPRDSSGRVRK